MTKEQKNNANSLCVPGCILKLTNPSGVHLHLNTLLETFIFRETNVTSSQAVILIIVLPQVDHLFRYLDMADTLG